MPNEPNSESGYFTADSSYTYMSSYNGTFKNTDTNYTSDGDQMKILNIHNIGKEYWMASRYILTNSNVNAFYVRHAYTNGNTHADHYLCAIYEAGSFYANTTSLGFRPVFTLKSGIVITGGAGTAVSPYTLGT